MNLVRVTSSQHRWLSSSASSSIPWISPLGLSKVRARKPDPPTESTTTCVGVPRKVKYICHESAINLIKREKDPQRALEIFNNVSEQKGFNHNNATYSTILHKLAMSKKFQAVDSILGQMTYETCKFHEAIFLVLMKQFSKYSLDEKVVEIFHAIRPIVREKPSLKAITTCLNLLIDASQVDLARQFLMDSKKNLNLKPNTCIFNILVKHHCKNGDLESAFEVVKEMKNAKISYPNQITYSTLIDGLCESGRLKEAIELFEEMISKDQILPDVLTYNVLINGFCRKGNVDRARKIMEFMKRNGCNPNVFNYSSLISGFLKAGRFEEAEEIFEEMKNFGLKPDKVGYTTMINCFCRIGRTDKALELLKEMKEKDCRPDVVTFNVILGGLCREDKFEEAIEMLERLPYQGMHLNKASYRIVLNLLCQKNDLKRASDLLDLMLGRGFLPHFATSNDLLARLSNAGMADDAAMALFALVDMGFKPEPDSWAMLVELISRERKLLYAFQLLDELICY
ncbi:Tetratricopeptide-like helical domain containing protein [Parasponia andersonii]|uniref:Tetratricopeptide-like helical domain containing protein n=1 Tax=Parasponia andersonii TaxID=3476 RepID=A0A2P5CQZ2_PARAD|nr:Tetratricopeptide-like helical domain containing protein [Parasponia andersonii]